MSENITVFRRKGFLFGILLRPINSAPKVTFYAIKTSLNLTANK